MWNDDDIQRAFVDNTVGKYFTGAIDFTIGNIAVGGVFGTAAKTGMLGARKVGLTTRAKNLTTVEKNIDDGILFAQSAGVSGIQTTIGNDIAKLSQTTDINEVSGILSK